MTTTKESKRGEAFGVISMLDSVKEEFERGASPSLLLNFPLPHMGKGDTGGWGHHYSTGRVR